MSIEAYRLQHKIISRNVRKGVNHGQAAIDALRLASTLINKLKAAKVPDQPVSCKDSAAPLKIYPIPAGHNEVSIAYEDTDRTAARSEQPVERASLLNRIGDIFHIGSAARSEQTILTNIKNAARRSECLSRIEHFLSVSTVDEEDGETYEESVLNWGADPDDYIKQFKYAWETRPKREIVDLRQYQGGFCIGDEVEYIGRYKNDEGWKGETFYICEVTRKYQSYSGDYFFEYTLTEKHKWKARVDGLFVSDLRLIRPTNEIEDQDAT